MWTAEQFPSSIDQTVRTFVLKLSFENFSNGFVILNYYYEKYSTWSKLYEILSMLNIVYGPFHAL